MLQGGLVRKADHFGKLLAVKTAKTAVEAGAEIPFDEVVISLPYETENGAQTQSVYFDLIVHAVQVTPDTVAPAT